MGTPLCPYADDPDLIGRYLARRLAQEASEAFEAHYFACDRCWSELGAGQEIRAALAIPAAGAEQPARLRTRSWGWRGLAVAACLVLAVLAVLPAARELVLGRRERVWRSAAGAALTATVLAEADGVRVSWTAVPEAVRFKVTVLSAEGVPLLSETNTSPSYRMPRQALEAHRTRAPLYVRVEALSSSNAVLATSDPVKLPVAPSTQSSAPARGQ